MAKKILFSVGENSGDLHAAYLARELLRVSPDLELSAAGGDRMQAAGVRLLAHYKDYTCNGLVEVIASLPAIARALRRLKAFMREQRPDMLVLVDFPDFNFKLGAYAGKLGIPVVYYISPQVWAWRKGRVRTLARWARRMMVIFEFEKKIYEEAGVAVDFVGHPLMDSIARENLSQQAARSALGVPEQGLVLGLLPGSRAKEVQKLLPPMMGAVDLLRRLMPKLNVAVSVASNLDATWVRSLDTMPENKQWWEGDARAVMAAADFCIVASGTATMETAIIGTPMMVVYKLNPLSYWIGKMLVDVPHIAMVNILAKRELVPELLQQQVNPGRLADVAGQFLSDPQRLASMRTELAQIRAVVGPPGAAGRAAQIILRELEATKV